MKYKLKDYTYSIGGVDNYLFGDYSLSKQEAQEVLLAANGQGKDPVKLAKILMDNKISKNVKVGYAKGAGAFIGEAIGFSFISLFLLLVVPPVGLLTAWVLSAWHCVIIKRRYVAGDIKQKVDGEFKISLWGWLLGPIGAGLVYGHYSGKDLNKKS
jgi:hypothetical protein